MTPVFSYQRRLSGNNKIKDNSAIPAGSAHEGKFRPLPPFSPGTVGVVGTEGVVGVVGIVGIVVVGISGVTDELPIVFDP